MINRNKMAEIISSGGGQSIVEALGVETDKYKLTGPETLFLLASAAASVVSGIASSNDLPGFQEKAIADQFCNDFATMHRGLRLARFKHWAPAGTGREGD